MRKKTFSNENPLLNLNIKIISYHFPFKHLHEVQIPGIPTRYITFIFQIVGEIRLSATISGVTLTSFTLFMTFEGVSK